MADPAHRRRRLPKPRISLLVVPRDLYLAALWLGIGHVLDMLRDWTGWPPLHLVAIGAQAVGCFYLAFILARGREADSRKDPDAPQQPRVRRNR